MAPETTSTAEHLRNALDGRWRDMKNQMRATLTEDLFRPHYTPNTVIARAKVAEQMRIMASFGAAADSFRKEHGGTGDVGAAITMIEMLAMSDLSLMVKAGVQWGLFGGAVENLGTERHHEAYVEKIINLELPGCFAMTETGHGSDVQSLETTATYDSETEEFIIDSPTPTARKDYIGGAAQTATMATVFAQLIITEEGEQVNHGVHCLMVPIRDADGNDLPGVTTSDCDYKGGLPGVDNGRIMFDHVRRSAGEPAEQVWRRRTGRHLQLADREPQPPVLHHAGHTDPRPDHRGRQRGRRDSGRAGHRDPICVAAQAVQRTR